MAKQQERKGTQTHAVSLINLVDPSSPISEQYLTIRKNSFCKIRSTSIVSGCRYAGTHRPQNV